MSSCLAGGPEADPPDPPGTTTVVGSTTPVTSEAVPTTSTTPGKTTTTTAATTTTTRPPLEPPTFESLQGLHRIVNFSSLTSYGLSRWKSSVPGIQDIRLTSTADGTEQPVLWLPPSGDQPKPLIVILHSWSAPYTQHAGIPYAMWAQENGWAAIAPEFRGRNDHVEAVGSDLAVQDVVDAIDYAVAQSGVDATRVYAVGYSGGGMMALLLAGRHPERVTAVAAWGAPNDLVDFYRQSRITGRHYYWNIAIACGGDPRESGPAQEECLRRSPTTYLKTAKQEGVAVFIAQGLGDTLVSPRNGANAFNQLAQARDRLTDEEIMSIGAHRIPTELAGDITIETYFERGDATPLFARRSGQVMLVFFEGRHDMVYGATARWFASDPG